MTKPPRPSPPSQERPARTLGEVLDQLPNRRLGKLPLLRLDPLPRDVLPELEIPGVDDETGDDVPRPEDTASERRDEPGGPQHEAGPRQK